jgi:S1-C subfamily serine protease
MRDARTSAIRPTLLRGEPRELAHATLVGVASALVSLALSSTAIAGESYLGIYAKSNSNVLEATNVIEGITVTRVVENSPAAAAGLRPGDVLLEANGVSLTHPDVLSDLEDDLPVGAVVTLRVERDQRVMDRELTSIARLAEPEPTREADTRAWIERRKLGVEVRSADPERLSALGLSERFGVEVLAMAEKSPLRNAGIVPGYVILEVDGERIPSAKDLVEYLASDAAGPRLDLTVVGANGDQRSERVRVHRPSTELLGLSIPPLISIDRGTDASEYSLLLGAFKWTRLANGSRVRILWLLGFETGATDELLEVEGAR